MNKRIPIIVGLFFLSLALWLLISPNPFIRALIERLDNLGYDLQLRTRVYTEKTPSNDAIAIVDVDDKSLKVEGRWPWPRSKLAQLVNELKVQGVSVIAFDIFFSEKENNIAENLIAALSKKNNSSAVLVEALKKMTPLFDEDTIFAKSLSQVQTVLALGFLPRKETQNLLPPPLLTLTPAQQEQINFIKALGYISNIPILQNAAKYGGFINIFSDNDGIIRRCPLLMEYAGKLYPALSLQTFLTFLGENVELITPNYDKTQKIEGIQIGNNIIPTDDKGQVLIPFIGKSYTFSYYSATDILRHHLPKNSLLGKIVFVGTSATGLGDLQATSIESPFPGVEIQATLLNGMLEHNFSYRPAWAFGAVLIITIFFGLLAACLFPYLGPRTLGAIIFVFPTSILLLNNWIWESSGLILSVLIMVLLVLVIAFFNIIYGYLFETRRREHLKEMFGQYVPEKHIDEMLKTTTNFALRGEYRNMSVLFADIRNFTAISEGMEASELVELLNTFFTPMTEIIFKHRGTIDKYVGDLIMAFWGAPLKDKNHARHSLQAGYEMLAKINTMKHLATEKNWPEIKVGISINSGLMNVGDMGSRYRRNYTVLGDEVNLASRLEGLTKFYEVNFIVTENTQDNQALFVFRQLDKVKVKGKKKGYHDL